MINHDETRAIQRRYNRIAPIYDLMEVIVEQLAFSQWRESLWSRVNGGEVLEVGVGTGKNLRYYPDNIRVTAVDFSNKMMARALRRSQAVDAEARFLQTDAQHRPSQTGHLTQLWPLSCSVQFLIPFWVSARSNA